MLLNYFIHLGLRQYYGQLKPKFWCAKYTLRVTTPLEHSL